MCLVFAVFLVHVLMMKLFLVLVLILEIFLRGGTCTRAIVQRAAG